MEGSVGVYLDTHLVRTLEWYYTAVAPGNMKLYALRVEEVTVLYLVGGYKQKQTGMVQHICNLSNWETEAGELPFRGQAGLKNENMSQKTNQNVRKK